MNFMMIILYEEKEFIEDIKNRWICVNKGNT